MNALRMSMLALSASAACACATVTVTAPTDSDMERADSGPEPRDATQVIRAYYTTLLKDPDSALFKPIGPPKRQWIASRFQEPLFGHLYCVSYNAKNSYGGYVGYKTDALMLRGETIVRVFEGAQWGGGLLC